MTNELNQPVWQWPYSAFGNNKPTGILKAAPNPKAAITNVPVLLKATAATEMGLRFPGQMDDPERGAFQNWNREYNPKTGRYDQFDPIGLRGGLNGFGYAYQNPLRYADPSGLLVPAATACLANPACAAAAAAAAAATCKATYDFLNNLVFNRPKNPPDFGPPDGWIQGPRRGRQYGPDGRPEYDIDKPHQGNEQDHVHEWPDGKREEPGRPVSPWPRQ
jgi:RHS repeat-associated protein